jgi:hypothetical protein
VHTELVFAHAESLGPFGLLQRHRDFATVGQLSEQGLGFADGRGLERDGEVVSDLEGRPKPSTASLPMSVAPSMSSSEAFATLSAIDSGAPIAGMSL